MEFKTGGIIKAPEGVPVNEVVTYLSKGCDYVIPLKYLDKYKELLDKLNEGGVE